jgi:AcrR family transcriptional regulator
MGIAERKAKEKEELKALILQGAKRMFLEKGLEQTTIRNIADAIEYSVGTVYVYYKDKNAIWHDLHLQGFFQLSEEMKDVVTIEDPMERLKGMGRAYLKFAMENPEMYDLMFIMRAPMEYLESCRQCEWDEGQLIFDGLKNTVQQCMEKGYFKGHTLEALSLLIWSAVHGMCSLMISERLRAINLESRDNIIADSLNEFFKMTDKI